MTKFQPTKAEIYEFKKDILSVLRSNPWATRAEVAQSLGTDDYRRVDNALRRMSDQELIHVKKIKGSTALRYRNTKQAFIKLREEYTVDVAAPKLTVNLGNVTHKLNMKAGKQLFRHLKKIYG